MSPRCDSAWPPSLVLILNLDIKVKIITRCKISSSGEQALVQDPLFKASVLEELFRKLANAKRPLEWTSEQFRREVDRNPRFLGFALQLDCFPNDLDSQIRVFQLNLLCLGPIPALLISPELDLLEHDPQNLCYSEVHPNGPLVLPRWATARRTDAQATIAA